MVNRQDWAICESVQRGMSSRAYTHGWFAPMEDDSADIRRWLLPRLGASVEPGPSVELVETTDE
jgi:Rieske 2Fe-2S family protein